MKVALSNYSLFEWGSPELMFHFAKKSLIDAGNKTVKWWDDFKSNKTIYEVEHKPDDVPLAGVVWEVIE